MIEIWCSCGEVYHADDSHTGRSIRCHICGTILQIEARRPKPLTQFGRQSVTIPTEQPSPLRYAGAQSESHRALDRIVPAIAIFAFVAVGIILLLKWKPRKFEPVGQPETAQHPSVPVPTSTQSGEPSKARKPMSSASKPRSSVPPEMALVSRPPSLVGVSCLDGMIPIFLSTGQRLEEDNGISGQSEFSVENGTSFDAVVRLKEVDTRATARLVIVKAHESYTIEYIEPGTYSALFLLGKGWVQECFDFQEAGGYQEFQEPLIFDQNQDSASTWSVSLQPVIGGTGKTRTIDRRRFFDGDRYVHW